jgi:flagellar export protein FliJ
MTRFKFPYVAVLDVRRAEERRQQQVVGELLQRQQGLQDELRRRQQFLDANRHRSRDALTGLVDIDGLRQHAGLAVQAMRRADAIVLELADLHRRVLEARTVLVDRMRQRRAVERLRDRMFDRWKRDMNRAQDRIEDDAAVVRVAWEECVA